MSDAHCQSLLLIYTINEILIKKNLFNLIQICVKRLDLQLYLAIWESPQNLYFWRRKSSSNWLLLLVIWLIWEISSTRSISVSLLTSMKDVHYKVVISWEKRLVNSCKTSFLQQWKTSRLVREMLISSGKMSSRAKVIFVSFLFIHFYRRYIYGSS